MLCVTENPWTKFPELTNTAKQAKDVCVQKKQHYEKTQFGEKSVYTVGN